MPLQCARLPVSNEAGKRQFNVDRGIKVRKAAVMKIIFTSALRPQTLSNVVITGLCNLCGNWSLVKICTGNPNELERF